MANTKIPQVADVPGEFPFYTGTEMEKEMLMRILIADGQSKVRFALRVLLERQPGLKVVGEAAHAQDLLAQAEATQPELVLLGWELSGLAQAGSLSDLRQACPNLHVIALSGRPEARQVALDAGADAFVSKIDPPERLLAAIGACEREQRETKEENRKERIDNSTGKIKFTA
jgi:DNA-binding NarL/FixJ family response regulator